MEIRVRLHPLLRAQLRKHSESAHTYRACLARLTAQVRELVGRHGPEILYAAVNPLPAARDDGGCAMSASRSRHAPVVLADVDPLGTAVIGETVMHPIVPAWRPSWRALKPAAPVFNGHRSSGPATLRIGAKRS
jgi:hypothetical protein